ncbi:MAG: 5-formyltetrahydrofolate cyclo-ligase [uncultured Nocardioidaceae bacterium]|uniref:5-formyltetrahydrofolate cyclo-ligase n=1 Tax=uncultured Nocardioidaceae bacterium TaxID=253824 RepID=A0A6J4MGM3_9ACTN|nr:MAG: 5-formyltetrahydrofolate cyclo-ligase [uncultured Nocardioidaceae bacterium]
MDPGLPGNEPADGSTPAGENGKAAWRARLVAGRREPDPAGDAARTRLLLALPEVMAAGTVAAYVSMRTEPDTTGALASLAERGVRVLLPVLLPDRDLDWAEAGDLVEGPAGLREPAGPRLGVDAVRQADVVICPGLAADRSGTRLGRGGGSYDRALARTRAETLRVLLLREGELVTRLPAEAHDADVDVVVTPTSVVRLARPSTNR